MRFGDGLKTLAAQSPDCVIEIGPHPTLIGFAGAVFGNAAPALIPSLRKGRNDWEQMLGRAGLAVPGGCAARLARCGPRLCTPHRRSTQLPVPARALLVPGQASCGGRRAGPRDGTPDSRHAPSQRGIGSNLRIASQRRRTCLRATTPRAGPRGDAGHGLPRHFAMCGRRLAGHGKRLRRRRDGARSHAAGRRRRIA